MKMDRRTLIVGSLAVLAAATSKAEAVGADIFPFIRKADGQIDIVEWSKDVFADLKLRKNVDLKLSTIGEHDLVGTDRWFEFRGRRLPLSVVDVKDAATVWLREMQIAERRGEYGFNPRRRTVVLDFANTTVVLPA
ncbi:hypothetical protein QBK99_11030 [Corticibacterium sp. UT-5YL-CI-8]|nr:hypothetical protein [Tianweitania sp. UT-5YL-CI-8]